MFSDFQIFCFIALTSIVSITCSYLCLTLKIDFQCSFQAKTDLWTLNLFYAIIDYFLFLTAKFTAFACWWFMVPAVIVQQMFTANNTELLNWTQMSIQVIWKKKRLKLTISHLKWWNPSNQDNRLFCPVSMSLILVCFYWLALFLEISFSKHEKHNIWTFSIQNERKKLIKILYYVYLMCYRMLAYFYQQKCVQFSSN